MCVCEGVCVGVCVCGWMGGCVGVYVWMCVGVCGEGGGGRTSVFSPELCNRGVHTYMYYEG